MRLPKLSEDGKDWLKIFGLMFVLIWACAISQEYQKDHGVWHLDIHIDDKTH